MIEKRFIGSCAGIYDKYKKNRWLWSEWEEITTILNNLNEKSVERSKASSKLQKENDQLKQELFEIKKDYLIETYSDNPARRYEKIQGLKEEFKERFGDSE